jgi:hypothetical protein
VTIPDVEDLPLRVYVAGPFRSVSSYVPGQQDAFGIHGNIYEAMKVALEVWRNGMAALCPHGNTHCFQNSAPDDVWLIGDLALMLGCQAVLMMPTWKRSSGARAEHEFALQQGLPVFYDIKSLVAWRDALVRARRQRAAEFTQALEASDL